MREITYVKAFTESLMQLMAEDDDVVVIGEDVAHYGGVFHAFDGLWKTYGERRVIDTPISEMGFIGMGVGAAARGLRPVCDLMFFDFIGVCLDQLYNQAAKLRNLAQSGSSPCCRRWVSAHERASAPDRRPRCPARRMLSAKDDARSGDDLVSSPVRHREGGASDACILLSQSV